MLPKMLKLNPIKKPISKLKLRVMRTKLPILGVSKLLKSSDSKHFRLVNHTVSVATTQF